MALKKETQQVRYTEQIGDNRGGGFSALADASITQANQLNNLTSQFADLGLKELKSFGTKIGKEAAENAVFSEVEQTVKLEDGTEIESRANRVLLFDPSKPHHSTSCTNDKRRVNININYL